MNDYFEGQNVVEEPEEPTYEEPAPVVEPETPVQQHPEDEAADAFAEECNGIACDIDFDRPVDFIIGLAADIKKSLLEEIEEASSSRDDLIQGIVKVLLAQSQEFGKSSYNFFYEYFGKLQE